MVPSSAHAWRRVPWAAFEEGFRGVEGGFWGFGEGFGGFEELFDGLGLEALPLEPEIPRFEDSGSVPLLSEGLHAESSSGSGLVPSLTTS